MYPTQVAARRTQDQEIILKRQKKIYLQMNGAGHEGGQVAHGEQLRTGRGGIYVY
jgi:2-oxoisovalerate dehydrogenase E1 component